MDIVYSLVLLIVAFFFLLLEVFLPSLGALTLIALGAFISSFYFAFEVGPGFGWSVIGVSAVGVPVTLVAAFRIFPKTALGKHMILFRPKRESPTAPHERFAGYSGKQGLSLTPLRPSGIVRLEGRRLDVVTRGEMIESGINVRVVEVLGNRIVVRAVDETPPPDTDRELP